MTELTSPVNTHDALAMVLLGHNSFQYLRSGVELGLFEFLELNPGATRESIRKELILHERAADILLLGVTALHLTERRGDGYGNSPVVSELFANGHWDLVKAVVGFEAYITYPGLADFTESLRANSNVGLRRYPGTGATLYHRLTENPKMLEIFYHFMGTWSAMASRHLIRYADFSRSRRILDIGGGDGTMAIAVAGANPHARVTVLELPGVAELARKRVAAAGLSDRIEVTEGDIFADAYPPGHDTVMFVHQLQIWPLDRDVELLTSAYSALPAGGRVVIMNSMSEDAGDGPLMAALASPFFAAVAGEGGMIYAWKQYEESLLTAGFSQIERIRCTEALTPHGIMVGVK